ncbi:MAG TPA: tyrosine-type recombinase/integrase, partial [Candidatus Saccharimonadales bacterium]|nr:tyrosine-type recombinase/integrase [Candidatus Saccharimonadales bacterium]
MRRNGQPYRSIRTTLATACTKAKLKDVTPHVLRHTFATGLSERGFDARAVQELGRWSKLAMLEGYGHVSLSRKAEAIEKSMSVHLSAESLLHSLPGRVTETSSRASPLKVRPERWPSGRRRRFAKPL